MLKPEVAQKELEKFKSAKFVEERLARLAKVPAPLRPTARTLFDVKEEDEDDDQAAGEDGAEVESFWEKERKRVKARAAAFRKLDAKQLDTLVGSAFPGVAPYVRRALDDAGRVPYTSGWGRKPFRAPGRAKLLADSRLALLTAVTTSLREYPDDVEWLAAWAPHAWAYGDQLSGRLLAAAIDADDAKGRKVFEILVASAKGEHEVGQMGRHVVAALLTAAKPEGWEFVEKLLLAAQREEGLRQTILELVDEGHPEAFRRFLRVVLEHDLVRFSATVRAVDTWFGFMWDAMSTKKAREVIEHALRFLDDPAAGDAAIVAAAALSAPKAAKGKKLVEADDAVEPAYVALWAKAFADVDTAIAPAVGLLDAPNPDVRFVATHLLAQLGLGGEVSKAIVGRLDDPDERVAARALLHFMRHVYDNEDPDEAAGADVPDLFERLERLIARAPEKAAKLAPIVWPWMNFAWGKGTVASALINALGDRPASRLLPHFEHFDARARQAAAYKLAGSKKPDASVRRTLLSLIGDASGGVRGAALKGLEKCTVTVAEAAELEPLLSRKASDLRRAVLSLLMTQDDAGALASADRLANSGTELPRLAGLELLRELASKGRSADGCRERAAAYRSAHPKLSTDEETQLDALTRPAAEALTLDDCLGLIDPATRTRPLAPQRRDVKYVTPAAVALLKGLDDLVHRHRERAFAPRNHRGDAQEEVLLGNCRWEFPHPEPDKPVAGQVDRLPFADVWLSWLDGRPKSMRDADGLELLRALWLRGDHDGEREKSPAWVKPVEAALWGGDADARVKLKYGNVVASLLGWLDALRPGGDAKDAADARAAFLLDGLEDVLAMLPPDKLAETYKPNAYSEPTVVWRYYSSAVTQWATFVTANAEPKTDAGKVWLYGLLRWMDEPGASVPRSRPGQDVLLAAFAAGGAVEADLYDHLLGPREDGRSYRAHSDLGGLCCLKPPEELAKHPAFRAVVERCRERVLEVELARGEAPTIASGFANSLRHAGGLDVLVRFLRAAEKNTFTRGHSWGSESKAVVFSHVIRATYPADGETPAKFAAAARAADIPAARLMELAVYAPQWAAHVEHAVGWPHLTEAVWWIRAHTRDRSWTVDAELRERWDAEVAQRTPLAAEDLLDGAVDVAWFNRTYEGLGKKRWDAAYDVAKFAASGGGHKRAQLFADAMLGRVKAKELVDA